VAEWRANLLETLSIYCFQDQYLWPPEAKMSFGFLFLVRRKKKVDLSSVLCVTRGGPREEINSPTRLDIW